MEQHKRSFITDNYIKVIDAGSVKNVVGTLLRNRCAFTIEPWVGSSVHIHVNKKYRAVLEKIEALVS